MAGKAGSMEAESTATKSEKGAVAGDAMQCPSAKRKAMAGSSYKDEEAEAASLDAAAIDKLLRDAILLKQRPGGLGPELKRRLTKGEIRSIIALKPEPFPSATDYLDELAEFEPPEVIAEMRRQHEEDVARFGQMDAKYEAFRQEVIKGIKENGYYEVDVEYVLRREKANLYAKQHNPFDFLTPDQRRCHVATPEQHRRWLREGCYGQYLPDEEEELLISYGEDDDDSDASEEEEDSDTSDEEEEEDAEAHRGPPVQSK